MASVLKNPHRRRILELLYSRKAMTPKEIAEDLKIGVPTVYYHLEILREYVQKTARGEFSITDKGMEAYKKEVLNSPESVGTSHAFVYRIISRPVLLLVMGLAAAAAELSACSILGYVPLLMGYVPVLEASSLFFNYAASLVVAFIVFEFASLAITRRLGGEAALFAGTMISRAPLLLLFLIPAAGLGGSIFSIIMTALAQLLSVFIMSIFLSLSRGLRQEYSIMICLIILYGNLLVYSRMW
ncbi:MAG: helix-turn-helix domain-containing protein [Candidatus Methanosuratincola sp.]|nr:helix-turn-helix domain-containing protein [Candidatus Methanosuratincola sp.]